MEHSGIKTPRSAFGPAWRDFEHDPESGYRFSEKIMLC